MAYNFYQNQKMVSQQINATQEQYEQNEEAKINDNINQYRNEQFNYKVALNQEVQVEDEMKEQSQIAGFGELIQSGMELPAGINSIKNTYQKVKQVYNNLGKTAENAKKIVNDISDTAKSAVSDVSDAVSNVPKALGDAVEQISSASTEPSTVDEAVRSVTFDNPLFEPSAAVSATEIATNPESSIMNAEQSRAFLNDRVDKFYGENRPVEASIDKDNIALKSDDDVIRAANRGAVIPDNEPLTFSNFNKYKSADTPEWLGQRGGEMPKSDLPTEQSGGAEAGGADIQTSSGLHPDTLIPNEEQSATKVLQSQDVSYKVAEGSEAELSAGGETTAAYVKPAEISEFLPEVEKTGGSIFSDILGGITDAVEAVGEVVDPLVGAAAAGLGAFGLIEGGKNLAKGTPNLPTPPQPPQMVNDIVPQANISSVAQPGI